MTATSETFRPLVKWPGGKTREWPRLAPYVPETVRHLVDPFMGGLAPFAQTRFTGHAYLNDRHERLVELHRLVQGQDPELFAELDGLAADWHALGAVARGVASTFAELVELGRSDDADRDETTARLAAEVELPELHRRSADGRAVADYVVASLADKSRRIPNLERRHTTRFTADALHEHAETAVRAGYYTLVRAHEYGCDGAARVADFLFVREYCYGSMFRTGPTGRFNIPYGGRSYDAKPFARRVERLRSEATRTALARATFHCEDFETFLDAVYPRLGPDDFVFADPPYHSEFSTYGRNAFELADHERLAATLARSPAPWLLVIKDTPEVRAIYLSETVRAAGGDLAENFGKRYGYNVRGRNRRKTSHLVVVGPGT